MSPEHRQFYTGILFLICYDQLIDVQEPVTTPIAVSSFGKDPCQNLNVHRLRRGLVLANLCSSGMIFPMSKTAVSHLLVMAIVCGLVNACIPSASPPTAPPPAPTATAVMLPQNSTHAVINHRTPAPVPPRETAENAEQSPVTATNCTPPGSDESSATRYDINAVLDYDTKTVAVEQDILFRNDTPSSLEEIVLYVSPNSQPGVFTLDALSLDNAPDAPLAVLEGVRLTVPLAEALTPHCQQRLHLTFRLQPPRMGTGYFPRHGYFGYNDRQFNLGHWVPTVAYHDGSSWVTPIPINVGEQQVIPAADFSVTLTVNNAPDGLIVVGPGTVQQTDATWHFELPMARDLTISLSDQYSHLSATSPTGVTIELYTLNDAQPPDSETHYNAPEHTLETATAAVDLYSDLYGPYPYERLVVLESAFPDGMEFSGLIFVGGEWFRSYAGQPTSYLTLITAHEVAHQWWYAIVGNDQSTNPWLDESLATYSELIFLQENYPDLTDWWWGFRVDSWSPQGYVDSTVYQFDTLRSYINAVYLRGAHLIHALRQEMGNEAFFQWLHDYVESMRGEIATPADLWTAMPARYRDATAEIRAAYLRRPNGTS